MIFEFIPKAKRIWHRCICGKINRMKPQYEMVFSGQPEKPIKSIHTCECGRQVTLCGSTITEVPNELVTTWQPPRNRS